MDKINNNSSIQETQTTRNNNIDTEGDFKGKKTTVTSSNKKTNSSSLKKFSPKSIFNRKTRKNTTEESQNSSQVKISPQQKKNLATIANIKQAITKYQEFCENKSTKIISDETLQLLQEAQSECNITDNDKAKSKIKELLTRISTDLQYNNISTKDLKGFRNEYAKEAQKQQKKEKALNKNYNNSQKKQQKEINTLYKNTNYGESSSKLNDAISKKNSNNKHKKVNTSYKDTAYSKVEDARSNKDYNNSIKDLLNEIINFRNEAVNEITTEIKQLDDQISTLATRNDFKSKNKLNETIEHKNNLRAELKNYSF
jgi:hypothetical protein